MARVRKDAAEIDATVAALPRDIPKDAMEVVKARLDAEDVAIFKVDYLLEPLTGLRRKMVSVTCTNCHDTVFYEQKNVVEAHCYGGVSREIGFKDATDKTIKSYIRFECPCCGKTVKAIHVSKIRRRYQINGASIATVHNVRGHLVLLSWWCNKICDKDGIVTYYVYAADGVMIVNGKPISLCAYTKFMSSFSWGDWKAKERYSDTFGRWTEDDFYYDPAVIEQTEAAHCALDSYLKNGGTRPGAYLWVWSKCPGVENLVKGGHHDFVNKMILAMMRRSLYYKPERFYICELDRYLNFKAKKPHEILRVEKRDMHLWHDLGLNLFGFRGFILNRYGIVLDRDRLLSLRNDYLDDWFDVFRSHNGFSPAPIRTFNYVDKQREICVRKIARQRHKAKAYFVGDAQRKITPSYLLDYWKMLYKVYGDYPEELKYPRDLEAAHDEMVTRCKNVENEKLRKSFENRFEALAPLSFTDEKLGLLIRPVASQKELIEEGEKLHHCVATYASDHSKGRTAIFFIRRIEAPDVPFFTLEYRGGCVAQNRGVYNCDRTPDVVAFEKEWLDFIKTEEENNGKCSCSDARECRIGA